MIRFFLHKEHLLGKDFETHDLLQTPLLEGHVPWHPLATHGPLQLCREGPPVAFQGPPAGFPPCSALQTSEGDRKLGLHRAGPEDLPPGGPFPCNFLWAPTSPASVSLVEPFQTSAMAEVHPPGATGPSGKEIHSTDHAAKS